MTRLGYNFNNAGRVSVERIALTAERGSNFVQCVDLPVFRGLVGHLGEAKAGVQMDGAADGVTGVDAVEEVRARSEADGLMRGRLSTFGMDRVRGKDGLPFLLDPTALSPGSKVPMRSRRRRRSSPASTESSCGVVDDRLRGCSVGCVKGDSGSFCASSLSETTSFSRAVEPKSSTISANRNTKLPPLLSDGLSFIRVHVIEDLEWLLMSRARRGSRRTALGTNTALRFGRCIAATLLAKADDTGSKLSLGILIACIAVARAVRLGAFDTHNRWTASLRRGTYCCNWGGTLTVNEASPERAETLAEERRRGCAVSMERGRAGMSRLVEPMVERFLRKVWVSKEEEEDVAAEWGAVIERARVTSMEGFEVKAGGNVEARLLK